MLTAMWRLGADSDTLSEALRTTPELAGLEPATAVPASHTPLFTTDTWEAGLGGGEGGGLYGLGTEIRFPAYRHFFEAEVAAHGPDGALDRYLPRLAHGIAGDFFHAVIELGYVHHLAPAAAECSFVKSCSQRFDVGEARVRTCRSLSIYRIQNPKTNCRERYHFESKCPKLLPVGLGWLAAAYAEIPAAKSIGATAPGGSTKPPAFTSAVEALAKLSEDPIGFPLFDPGDGSSGYIAAVEDLVAGHAAAVLKYELAEVDPCSHEARAARLRDVCAAAIDSFAGGGFSDFYTLHSVTGSRAVWAIANGQGGGLSAEVEADLVRSLWRAILYTHVARNRPPLPFCQTQPVAASTSGPSGTGFLSSIPVGRPWRELTAAALASRNSHIIKLVMTCADFWDRWHDPRFWRAADGLVAAREAGCKLVGTGVGSQLDRFLG
jgi:hypothetical protein